MPANGELNLENQIVAETNFYNNTNGLEGVSTSSEEEDSNSFVECELKSSSSSSTVNKKMFSLEKDKNLEKDSSCLPKYASHPVKICHEKFLRNSIEEILNLAVFNATDRNGKVLEWHNPEELKNLFDFSIKQNPDSDAKLTSLLRDVIKYSVKTGHPYFVNQLFSSVDPYGLVGQWLTDALNPSVYTYEVAPIFSLMEEVVLHEMRRIVGFPDNGNGDGIFCPGGSIANGYAISCARYKFLPDIKTKGLCSLPRLVLFTSEDSHYSVEKLASFMGIGSQNVYKIDTDCRGKLKIDHLESEILRAKSEGALPFMVSATAGTTVLGAFDPLEDISYICKKYNLWMHVDAAWGGGALISKRYKSLLKGIEKADSVTWNPHKLLAAPQQCSTFLTKHKDILSKSNSTNATYLFQKDKFYDVKYDTGDKHIQCGRRADVLKFWFMWRAKGTEGLEKHVDQLFENSEYITQEIKTRSNFKMVLDKPECTNVCFWYIPNRLLNKTEENLDFDKELHRIAPKIKERMMKEGSMMITYQPLRNLPNFFRLVLQNSALNKKDMQYFIDEIERLGADL